MTRHHGLSTESLCFLTITNWTVLKLVLTNQPWTDLHLISPVLLCNRNACYSVTGGPGQELRCLASWECLVISTSILDHKALLFTHNNFCGHRSLAEITKLIFISCLSFQQPGPGKIVGFILKAPRRNAAEMFGFFVDCWLRVSVSHWLFGGRLPSGLSHVSSTWRMQISVKWARARASDNTESVSSTHWSLWCITRSAACSHLQGNH